MYMLNMAIILIVMYSNVTTAIDKIHTYLLCFNSLIVSSGHSFCLHSVIVPSVDTLLLLL